MAPCSNVRFTYRGHTPGGNQLARLLSEMSIEYTEGNKSVSADVAALIVKLDKRVISDQVVAEEASRGTQPMIQTAVPLVHSRGAKGEEMSEGISINVEWADRDLEMHVYTYTVQAVPRVGETVYIRNDRYRVLHIVHRLNENRITLVTERVKSLL